ncbi:hypothetical protein [Sphingobacterium lactis]|uniref:hypothetical protein n=1 Tax=Sphingobacterium lactis TaxID=797291 RepID=UPI003DA43381
MKIRCINNTGLSLRSYEYEPITNKEVFGRFGVSEMAEYGIEIGKEYLVMGLITFQTYQAYLIDDNGFISACPCQLFEVVDNKVNSNWHFRLIEKDEDIYPFVQAILGYPELCFDKHVYENLIVEMKQDTRRIYFRRKMELEKN